LILLLAIVCILPNTTFAQLFESDTKKAIMEEQKFNNRLQEYLIAEFDQYNNFIVEFNEEKAISNGESEELIEVGREVMNISSAYLQDPYELYSISLPIWGNYCGPGYGTNDRSLPPTDILDEGCMEHDACYKHAWGQTGVNCECNQDLIDHIDNNINHMHGTMKTTARAIKAYFWSMNNLLPGCNW